jgi:hypothetical protein
VLLEGGRKKNSLGAVKNVTVMQCNSCPDGELLASMRLGSEYGLLNVKSKVCVALELGEPGLGVLDLGVWWYRVCIPQLRDLRSYDTYHNIAPEHVFCLT